MWLEFFRNILAIIFKIPPAPSPVPEPPKPDPVVPAPVPVQPPEPNKEEPVEDIFSLKALPLVLIFEGGYSDNPKDYGGRTMRGITQREYDTYRSKKGFSSEPVKSISDDEVRDIYLNDYWLASQCDKMTEKLSVCVFDTSVNNGQGRSIKTLQRAIGATVDGVIGPETIAKAKLCDPVNIANTFMDIREQRYKDIVAADATQQEFLGGWLRRSSMVRAYVNGTKTIEEIRKEW